MKHEDPRRHEDELDASLTALFQSVEPPEPRPGFASRTMNAVRRAPLPAGRRALRLPWTTPAGWAALVAAAAAAMAGVAVNQPAIAESFASLVGVGIRLGMWFLGSVHTGFAIYDLFARAGGMFARVMSTREASAALTLMTGVAAFSLLMLNRLLCSEKESSSW
jgi:hypothetical protein